MSNDFADETADALIVGGGVAGLSTGLVLGRIRRSVLVVDAGDPRNAPATHVHGYLSRDGAEPGELLRIGRKELAEYGGRVHSGEVVRVDRTGAEFILTCADGTRLRGRRLVLATGLADELPDISGLAPRWARDVVHCPYCHGWELRDRPTGVLVSTAEDFTKAMVVSRLSPDTMLFLHDAAELSTPHC